MADFVMPILGADMEDGTLVEWRKQVGDPVHRGDVIAEVETEKGLIEVEAFIDGVLEKIVVEPGAKVPVGTVLAVIRESGPAAASAQPAAGPAAPEATTPPAPAPSAPAAPLVEPSATTGHLRASPAARRRAGELGVDLSRLQGTGPDGAIQVADVERAATQPAGAQPAPPAPSAERPQRMRETIAAAMARSKREIPHYYLATTIDLDATMEWLARRNAELPLADRLLPGAVLLKAVARALREVPALNAVWQGDHAEPRENIHVGVAISLRGGGLVAPALHDADRATIDDLMRRLKDLVARTRAGRLRSSELSDGTITVTNLGDQGVESVFGVIYPPQVAIVGLGKIVERPLCVDGRVVARRVVSATLSADHRVTDGHLGGRFLAAVDRLLQKPEEL